VLEIYRSRRKFAPWREHHTPWPTELEPTHEHGQHGESPAIEAVEVKNRVLVGRTKERPHSKETSGSRAQVHDVGMANPDPPVHGNAGKRRLLPKIPVQSYDPEMEFSADRRGQVCDALSWAATFVAGKITSKQD
jgi:hypothetical protein